MNWREKYAHKLVTPQEAISHIRSGDTIHSTMYSSLPYALFEELGAQKNRLEGVNIYMGFGGGLYRPLAKACNGHVRDLPKSQIGVDVEEAYRGKGMAAELVRLLKEEILRRGEIPFYSVSQSHILSMNTAVSAGFLPAWSEIYVSSRF